MIFWKRARAALCCILILTTLAAPCAAAEGTIACNYVTITENGFVAETMDGVESLYNLDGATLYCVELVVRYYEEVYGLSIRCSDAGPAVLNNSDLYFEPTDDPQHGDVLYGSAAARGKGYSHWALVRSNNGDSLTLFEQNWRWNGQAGIGRTIEFPTDCYQAYTLKSRSGAAIVQRAPAAPATASDWAVPYATRAAEAGIASLHTDYQANITRDEFCQMALVVLARHGVAVPEAESAIAAAMAVGLVNTQNGQETIRREEAAVITGRLMERLGGLPAADLQVLSLYADAAEIAPWAADAVASMTTCGLMSGSKNTFRPKGTMTNEQAVTLMVRVDENPTALTAETIRVAVGWQEREEEQVVSLGAANVLGDRIPKFL